MARGRGSGKHSGSKPTSKARNTKQEVRERYSKAREDAQLTGLIPTTPEGAIHEEVVNPTSQEDSPHPELVAEAIRRGWAVPEDKKPKIVDELLTIVTSQSSTDKVKVAAFNALRMADQNQYDRDHPTTSSSTSLPGSNTTNITNIHGDVVNNKLVAAATIREMIERGELGLIENEPENSRPTSNDSKSEIPNITGSLSES